MSSGLLPFIYLADMIAGFKLLSITLSQHRRTRKAGLEEESGFQVERSFTRNAKRTSAMSLTDAFLSFFKIVKKISVRNIYHPLSPILANSLLLLGETETLKWFLWHEGEGSNNSSRFLTINFFSNTSEL